MKAFGLILLSAGFLGAAIVTVQQTDAAGQRWATIDWQNYITFFVLGTVGVVLVRLSSRGTATEAHKLDSDLQSIEQSLASLVEKIGGLNARKDTVHVYDVHVWIDDNLIQDLDEFVEARESLIHIYGLQRYADLMNQFATSERNINRSWSASADGYVDEVWRCMEHAHMHMTRAKALLDGYVAQ